MDQPTVKKSKLQNRSTPHKLRDLTNKWYKKLKDDGFSDIEFYDTSTGFGQNSDYLKNSAAKIAYKYSPETAQHYRICSNFLAHYQFPNDKVKFIFSLYCDGITFREIIKRTKAHKHSWVYISKGKPRLSLFTLHHMLKKYIKLAYDWNKTDPEGIMLDEINSDQD